MQVLHSIEARQQASVPTFTPLAPEAGAAVDAVATQTKPTRTRIEVAQWLAELNKHPDLIRDLLASAGSAKVEQQFPDLRKEKRVTVDTATAAHWLSRKSQTLRGWACLENGPLRPIRINGRLAWNLADIRRLLGVPA